MKRYIAIIFVLSVVFALIAGYEGGKNINVQVSGKEIVNGNGIGGIEKPQPTEAQLYSFVEIRLPAVDTQGNGALAYFNVKITKGDGQVYLRMDSENPLTNPDTQTSLRTALEIAKGVSKNDAKDLNIYYSFTATSDVVGGKSAGAAMAIASIAALRREKLKEDILITGTLEGSGKIGVVGKVLSKAKAAKSYGFRKLLVPKGEAVESQEFQNCTTEIINKGTYQTCKTSTVSVDVAKEAGIQIQEVNDIFEAYSIMKEGGKE